MIFLSNQMPPKKLKIDLTSKPAATNEDQELNYEIFQDRLDATSINTSVYQLLFQNLSIEVFSQEPLTADQIKRSLIPESPSAKGKAYQPTNVFSVISPRSIMSPHFKPQIEFPQDQPPIPEAKPIASPMKQNAAKDIRDIMVPQLKIQDQEETDIIEAICTTYPDGVTLHSMGPHPAHAKSTILAKKYNRTQFEVDEEVRIVNDVLFEGVFGLPGFLAWNALPLALAHYGGGFTVPFMEEQLLTYGDTITALFAGDNAKQQKFTLTPNMLRRWYADMFAGRSLHDRLFNVLRLPTANVISSNDLQRITLILLRLHPGLAFLTETPQFQQLYAQTAALRVLFENDSNLKGCLNAADLKKIQCATGTTFSADLAVSQRYGGILESLWQSQYEQDINRNLKCFSYEHFYVFYVTFWELDKDHDKLMTIFDLEHYADNCLCKLAVKRSFDLLIAIRRRQWFLYDSYYEEKHGKKGATKEQMLQFFDSNKNFLFYTDFVRFLIMLENPDLDVAVDFWFEICDIDADGVIGWLDFKAFFDQQREHMEAAGMDIIEAQDAYCQMIDFYKLRKPGYISTDFDTKAVVSKMDVQRSQARGNIFSVMFHFQRLQQFDQKDPYTIRQYMTQESTMWERFCRRQYDTQVQGQSTSTTTNNSQSNEYMM